MSTENSILTKKYIRQEKGPIQHILFWVFPPLLVFRHLLRSWHLWVVGGKAEKWLDRSDFLATFIIVHHPYLIPVTVDVICVAAAMSNQQLECTCDLLSPTAVPVHTTLFFPCSVGDFYPFGIEFNVLYSLSICTVQWDMLIHSV